MLHRRVVREEMLQDLSTNNNCRKIIRMSVEAFKILCQKLENECGLRPTQRMSVEEQVARFLHIVGNDVRTRFVSWLYRQSVSATSRHFNRVLNAIISLEEQYIKQPTGDIVQKEIQEKLRFYPFFKDCIGAIDGTHVRVRVPNRDTPIYRGRKGYPTINVFVACTFDLKFTYVLSGWEGTASDSRIVKVALTRDDKLIIPNDRDKELEDEVIDEMLAASHDEEPHGPRDTDDRGEQIRNSIANDMWRVALSGYAWNSSTRLIEAEYDVWGAIKKQAETVEQIDHLFENNVINLDNIDTSNDIHVTSPTPQSDVHALDRNSKVIENSHPHVYTEGKIYEELTCLVLERKDIHTAYAYLLENLVKTRGLFGCLIEHILFYLKAIMGLGDSEDSNTRG
ncbi:putative nuclease HARBI1 [Tanacetum coccineum]